MMNAALLLSNNCYNNFYDDYAEPMSHTGCYIKYNLLK